jgi:hypothetical protein
MIYFVTLVLSLVSFSSCQYTSCDGVIDSPCSCFNATTCANAKATDDVFSKFFVDPTRAKVSDCLTATQDSITGIRKPCRTETGRCAFQERGVNSVITNRDCANTGEMFKFNSICCVVSGTTVAPTDANPTSGASSTAPAQATTTAGTGVGTTGTPGTKSASGSGMSGATSASIFESSAILALLLSVMIALF